MRQFSVFLVVMYIYRVQFFCLLFRWKMDDPEMILNGALENHYKMINEFKVIFPLLLLLITRRKTR